MSYLLDLPCELREQVFNYCYASDLKNLACCSSIYSAELKPILWHTIHIGCRCLLKLDWGDFHHQKKLENLEYTRTLRLLPQNIEDPDCESDFSYDNDGCKEIENILLINIGKIVKCCKKLDIFYIDRFMVYGIFCGPYVKGECLQFVCTTLTTLKSLSITSFAVPINIQKAITKHYTDLSELHLYSKFIDYTIPINVYEAISKVTNLSELNLHSSGLCDTDLSVLCKSLIKLRILNLACTNITDQGLSYLAKLTSLVVLNINECVNITNLGLSYVGGLVTLQYLDISYFWNITDEGTAHLSTLTSLKKLYMDTVSDSCIPTLCALTSLQHLGLMGSNITDDDLRCLQSINISLLELKIAAIEVTNIGMSHISALTSLRKLDISDTNLEDSGLYEIRNLCLHVLNVSNTNVTDTGFKHLSSWKALHTLICSGINITDNSVLFISSLDKLRELNMRYCTQLTDIALSYLRNMLLLERIDISNTNVTDVGLKYLTSLRSLRTLICNSTGLVDDFPCQVELVYVEM